MITKRKKEIKKNATQAIETMTNKKDCDGSRTMDFILKIYDIEKKFFMRLPDFVCYVVVSIV